MIRKKYYNCKHHHGTLQGQAFADIHICVVPSLAMTISMPEFWLQV